MTGDDKPRGVLRKALTILRCLADGPSSVSLAEVSRRADLDRSTTHRLLQVLVDEGMVHQDPETRLYRLHVGILQLAGTVIQNLRSTPNARVHLEHLRNITDESAGYHVRVGFQRVCLEEVESAQPLRMASGVSRIHPLCAGAPGKVIVAFLPDKDLKDVLSSSSALGPWRGRIRELRDELETVRERGFALSFEETTPGARAIAAPVRDFQGRVIGSINLAGPASRFLASGDEADIARLLLDTAEKVSAEGGYLPAGKAER